MIKSVYPGRNKFAQNTIKVIIAFVLLIVLLTKLDIEQMISSLAQANISFLFLATAIFLARNIFAARRWQLLLATKGIKHSLIQLTRYYLIGAFFSLFLPSAVSGDIIRAYYSTKDSSNPIISITAVIVERIIGLIAILSFAFGALILSTRLFNNEIINWISIIGVMLLLFTLVLFFINLDFLQRYKFSKLKIVKELINYLVTIQQYRHQPRVLLSVFGISLLYQLLAVFSSYISSLAIGETLGFNIFLVIFAISSVLSMIPISLGGIGVREGSMTFLLVMVGVNKDSAGLISLIGLFFFLIQGIVGVVAFLSGPKIDRNDIYKLHSP